MIGLFLRWRQLGRRYFWPHLLLGMVAASLGLPVCAQGAELNASSESPSSSLFVGNGARFDHLIRLQESVRRPSFTVDYWHQHAIRTVIRHLSFTLAPQAETPDTLPLAAHKLALIDSLQALLTTHTSLRQPLQQADAPHEALAPSTSLADWRSKTHAIRAGPSTLLV
ncbi:secA translation cis-regulator SecM [Candidatus Pantoea deserta]|uniref:secA translation cis-regulator SecM n=1 Tax=Candidatus Pantoea deserta TaxID=1869313 RepID=UPI0018F2A400|nr:secA translation cis-regulator SecM [Pantoea deserta]